MPKKEQPMTWIVVADGRSAQIYMPQRVAARVPLAGRGKHRHIAERHEPVLEPVLAEALVAEPASRYQTGRNQTGMVFESASSARHMAEPRIDARSEVKLQLAQRVADVLNDAKTGASFQRLVLVAPPTMLGAIEARLKAGVRRKMVATLAKTVTRKSPRALASYLQEFC